MSNLNESTVAGGPSENGRRTRDGKTGPRCPVCGSELRKWATEPPQHREQSPFGGSIGFCESAHCGARLRITDDGTTFVDSLRLVKNSSMCVLAFSFGDSPEQDPWRRLKGSSRWDRKTFSLSDPEDVDRTEYFLPYIRRFLFPSLDTTSLRKSDMNGGPDTCEHYRFRLDRLGTTNGSELPLDVQCDDVRKDRRFHYRIVMERIELIVFSYRCAFLVLKFRHPDAAATLFDQMNSLIFLRHFAPQHRGFQLPKLSTGDRQFTVPQLLSYLLQEFRTNAANSVHPAEESATPTLPVSPIYDDRMMIYSFSCLDRESAVEQVDLNRAQILRAAVIPVEHESGARGVDLKNESLDHWRRLRWSGYSKDGGTLIAFNTDSFHEKFLGVYHETYYFDVFLLAALQRVTLITLFDRLSDIGRLTTGSRASHRLLRKVRYDLLRFTNQCCFSQITNREKGQELSRKWQQVFENRTLMDEVHEQSDQLETYLRNRTSQQVETLVRMGGFLATAFPAILGLNVLLGTSDWVENLKWFLLITLILGIGLFTWFRLYRQSRDV